MAKKPSTKKTFKSFFSKSEANLSETVEEKSVVEKNATDKKKFKFSVLKVKSKSSAASEKSAPESQQVLSVAKPEENEENLSDNVSTDTDRSSLYATAPRSKGKELSLSERDLNKPKRFATFSFGLKKKKRKNDILSKSTFGIDGSGFEAQQETPSDFSHMPLAQTNKKTMSMSQPELDTSELFDIPTPPPVALNIADSPLPSQPQTSVTVHTQPNHKPLTNVQNLSQETQKAPIASIVKVNLDDNKVNTVIKETLNVSSCKEAKAASSQVKNTISDFKAPDSVSGNTALSDKDNVRESSAKPESSLSQQTQSQKPPEIKTTPTIDSKMAATVTDKQTDSSATVSNTALATKLTNVDTKSVPRITEPSPISTTTLDPLAVSEKVPVSQTASSIFETEKKTSSNPITIKSNTPVSTKDNSTLDLTASDQNITISQKQRSFVKPENKTTPTSSQTTKKTDPSANQCQVYGALYDSLFPQRFTTEVISSLLKEQTKMASDIRHLEVKTETVLVKMLDEQYSDRSTSYSASSRSYPEKTEGVGSSSSQSTSQSGNISSLSTSFPKKMDDLVGSSSTSQSGNISSSLSTSLPKKMDDLVGYSHTHSSSQSVNISSSLSTSFPKKMDDLLGSSSTSQSGNISSSLSTSLPKMDDLVGYSSTRSSSQSVNISSSKTSTVAEKTTKDNPKPVYIRRVTTYDVTSDVASKTVSERVKIAYSEFNSETKFDNVCLENTVKSTLSSEKSPAPPIFEYAAPQETNALVTDPKRKVILVKELVTDETGADSSCSSPVLEKMSVLRSLEKKIEESDVLSVTSGQTELYDGICSPAYLSVGSDDGSMMEIYYSAEEDTEELFTVDEKETTVTDIMKDVSAFEDLIPSRTFIAREDDNATMVVKMNSEEKPFEVEMHLRNQKIQEQKGSGMSNLSQSQEREAAVQVMKDEKEKKVEFLATPVKQVKEFQVVPPFTERHGHEEGLGISQTALSERKDHPTVQVQLPNNEIQNVPPKEVNLLDLGPESVAKGDKRLITPKFTEAAELVLSTTDKSKYAAKTIVADNSEQESDATGLRDNRAALSSEGADTVTQSTGKNGTEQVAVELSAQNNDKKKQLLPQDQVDLSQGSLTSLKTPASEVSVEEKQSDTAVVEPDDKMSSSFSSLSTTLSLKTPSLPTNEEAKYRFRKVSLVSKSNESNQDTVDFKKTMTVIESSSTDLDSDYKWRQRFEGFSRLKPFSDSIKTSDVTVEPLSSSATAFPEAKDYNSTVSSAVEKDSTFSQTLSDRREIYVSSETETGSGWGLERSWEEFSAPAGDRAAQREGETDGIKYPDSSVSITGYSTLRTNPDDFNEEDDSYSGVFKATLVDFIPESPTAPPASTPSSPEENEEMDSLVDTLKNMAPSLRMRSLSARGPQATLMSSLPPIVEDSLSPVTAGVGNKTEMDGLNGLYILPPDIGLKSRSLRDTRSPLELLKQSQQEQQVGSRSLNMPLRASATNSIVMRNSADSPTEDLPSPVLQNGPSSRLDNSIIFSSFRSSSMDHGTSLENGKSHRAPFRAASLPEIGLSNERMSVGPREKDPGEIGAGTDSTMSRYERLSFLFNSSSSSSSSLTGAEDYSSRMSLPPSLGISSPSSSNSPTPLLSPTGSIEMNPLRVGVHLMQRSFSGDSSGSVQQPSMFNNVYGGPHFQNQEPEPERNLMSKYRAFPDAYLTKEKEHGKLNPHPGKMYIFDRPGMCGQRIEIGGDIMDATSWELEETFSVRVVRGGWVLYEKPNFKGEKVALDEGDIELTCPFGPIEEELLNGEMGEGQMNGVQTNGETSEEPAEDKPVRRLVIGSIRRAVRDYSVPEISLFPEENAEGKKVVFRDSSEDARIFGFPIKANSIIINAGLWLVYAQPFFQGAPRVLEVGGYSNPAAWGVEQPYIASLHPLKIGEPHVENMGEPKMVVYEKPYFCGKSRTIATNTKDFMTREDRQQKAFMHNVGSLKVVGGIWVGYEKEGFRGHQYLLEEGDYQDWRVWGGCDSEMRSVRVIRADLTDPVMMMFEQPDEEAEEMQEDPRFEVTEAIPDVELFGFKPSTQSIHVLSGAWVAYSHVDYSGDQYILEKGFYNNCADWGSQDNRICSVQPILKVPRDNAQNKNEIFLYNEQDFQGQCHVIDRNNEALSDKILPKSCRVTGGSWVLYENKEYSGNLYVLSEGDYPNLTSMGCPAGCYLRSIKAVPRTFAVPSISLFGLECLEGREITTESEICSLVEEGYNNHILSVRVNSGCWVICEHGNYRGRQFLLEPIEITNWPKFSSLQTIGSMYPIRQKRSPFRIRNKERGQFLSVQGGVEELKSGRVVVTPEVEPMSDIWYYQDGLIKNKLSPTMSLQVMGKIEPAAKVVLWTETRQPVQTWTAQMRGLITSLTFPGMVLDVKGGKTYDKDHVVIMPEDVVRPSQQWEIELL